MHRSFFKKVLFCFILCIFSGVIDYGYAKSVKTSYKRYSIFKVKDTDILCEPYVVNKDDWLYKIFRKKGEISEKDFPYFLMIFKKINPEISNIDAIAPGIHILIPLKKVQKNDYDQSTPGTVDVPVVEFSSLNEELDIDLKPFLKKHQLKKGENVSSLLDKAFLEKSGRISEEGLRAFRMANPDIKNINIVYEGKDIYLPDPSIKSQPWFQSFLSTKKKNGSNGQNLKAVDPIDEHQLVQLKKYASLIGGTLLSQGKMYFPGYDEKNRMIDLSSSPVIETEDGTKILILSGENVNQQLLESVQAYWNDLKVQLMAETIDQVNSPVFQDTPPKPSRIDINKKLVGNILYQMGYDYLPNAKIPFTLNKIQLEASFGRVALEDTTDLLINFGNVYGTALEVLEKKEFQIISILPEYTPSETVEKLVSSLDYVTWINPSFHTGEKVETIMGIYATKDQDKLFFPIEPMTNAAAKYLKSENILILSIKNNMFEQTE